MLVLNDDTKRHIADMLTRYPATNREYQELIHHLEKERVVGTEMLSHSRLDTVRSAGRLGSVVPQIPPQRGTSILDAERKLLPTWNMANHILQTILSNRVTIVMGDTGSGKTTQVPQYLLDYHNETSQPCRIICTQPRRLAAVTTSERVAAERDERVGNIVGFQIRMESKTSVNSLLTFCTNGVLLRTIMGNENVLASITHVIVDEVHERDRYADFLLIVLKQALERFSHLRLVLMSAAMDSHMFSSYFGGCPIISVPGRLFPVMECFLEDILKSTGYCSDEMKKVRMKSVNREKEKQQLEQWWNPPFNLQYVDNTVGLEKANDPASMCKLMDLCLMMAFMTEEPRYFQQLLHMIERKIMPVDYQHSDTSATALMVACGKGNVNAAEQLLNLGADVNIRSSNNWTAIEWAQHLNHIELVGVLSTYGNSNNSDIEEIKDAAVKDILDAYQWSVNNEAVDLNLILHLVIYIHTHMRYGAVLIFLPGYEDIVMLREKIHNTTVLNPSTYTLFVLHSNIQSADQKRVFDSVSNGKRKIILSTNIAETSVTIKDVVYVIDSGKVKEKTYSVMSDCSSLKVNWVSKASAIQRSGRAGRCQEGMCFRLYSRQRFCSFEQYQEPELLRTPLQDLCLHTKSLAPPNTPIADFLSKAPQRPPMALIKKSVQLLKTMDALDPCEELTEMGIHLLDLAVEPRLGKMLLYSVVLKCIDPILTIVAILAYKDPFVLPSDPARRVGANETKCKLAAGSMSDHMTLLRIFQAWQNASDSRSFSYENCISSSTLDVVTAIRMQLLGQLRASGFVRTRGCGDLRDLNMNSENWAVVKAALCAATYPNIARVDRKYSVLRSKHAEKVRLHPSSSLLDASSNPRQTISTLHTKAIKNLPTDWLIYEELIQTGSMTHIKLCTALTPLTVMLFAGPSKIPSSHVSTPGMTFNGCNNNGSDSEWEEGNGGLESSFQIDDWSSFRMDDATLRLTVQLRYKWYYLFLRRMRGPTKPWQASDDAVLQAVVSALSIEERHIGLTQPSGIGQRPKILSPDFISIPVSRSESAFSYPPPRQQRLRNNESRRESTQSTRENNVLVDSFATMALTADDLHDNTRYFLVKVSSQYLIELSAACGIWSLQPVVQRRTMNYLKEGKKVILVMSVYNSNSFQGFAKLFPEILPNNICPQAKCMTSLGSLYRVEWIRKAPLKYYFTRHVTNSYNNHQMVYCCRDGQEIEPAAGAELCHLWDSVQQHYVKGHLGYSPRMPF